MDLSYTLTSPVTPVLGAQEQHRRSDRLLVLLNVCFDVSTTYVVLTLDYMPPHMVFQDFLMCFFDHMPAYAYLTPYGGVFVIYNAICSVCYDLW